MEKQINFNHQQLAFISGIQPKERYPETMTVKEKMRACEGKGRFIVFATFLHCMSTGLSVINMRKRGVL
jgi:hypothetical protein